MSATFMTWIRGPYSYDMFIYDQFISINSHLKKRNIQRKKIDEPWQSIGKIVNHNMVWDYNIEVSRISISLAFLQTLSRACVSWNCNFILFDYINMTSLSGNGNSSSCKNSYLTVNCC